MHISLLCKDHIAGAAALFANNFRQFRQTVPYLPDRMENPSASAEYLDSLLTHSQAVAAFDGERLVGYLGWWLVDGFRDTDRKAAYCPVWAHAVSPAHEAPADAAASAAAARHTASSISRIYRALYRAASEVWFAEGCQTHAITLLAGDAAARDAWFWNGFGLTVVDALRTLEPIGVAAPDGYTLRMAKLDDCQALAQIEAEHWQHYAQPPTLMTFYSPSSAEDFAQLLADPANRVWMAWQGANLAGYARFEGLSHGATEIVAAQDTTACTGAYTRPQYRGQRVMAALLEAVLQDYRENGYARCSVDFESFNPEAASFWTKYFEPVCYSVIRVPERVK